MGGPRKLKKQYKQIPTYFDLSLQAQYNKLETRYGLKNRKEIHKMEGKVQRVQRLLKARYIESLSSKRGQKKIDLTLNKLKKLGVLNATAELNEALRITPENFLERRLQTLVFKKGLAPTIKRARQQIRHGKVFLFDKKVKMPSTIIPLLNENQIIVK
jgi:small subunit ribosomal protein S4